MYHSKKSEADRAGRTFALLSGLLLCAAASLRAEGPSISGFIDTNYIYNFQRPASGANAFRSYDAADDTIHLHNAQLTFQGTMSEGVGYYIEPNYGSDALVNTTGGSGTGDDFDIQEAYLTYAAPGLPLSLKAGKFVTLQGIEVIESKDNPVVSRGYLFGLAEAFTHVGAMLTLSAPKVASVSLGVINGWDLNTDNNRAKTLISKLGLDFGPLLNGGFVFYYGAEKAGNTLDHRFSFDSTWYSKPSDMVSLAWQFNAGTEEKSSLADGAASHWYGFTVQPKVDFCKWFGLGVRYEWFQNLDGDRAANPNFATDPTATPGLVLQNLSLAPAFHMTDNLMFRTELRHDWASELAFERDDGTFSKGEQTTISGQLIYTF